MTLDQIVKYVNYICDKDNSGNTLGPSDINTIFPVCNMAMFNRRIEQAQAIAIQKGVSLSETLLSIIELMDFSRKQNINFITSMGNAYSLNVFLYMNTDTYNLGFVGMKLSGPNLPLNTYITSKRIQGSDYIFVLNQSATEDSFHPITFTDYPDNALYNLRTLEYGYWISLTTIYNGKETNIELISEAELQVRRTNLLAKDLSLYPVAVINNKLINVYPNNITSAEFSYLKQPSTPVYDYYLDISGNIIYLNNSGNLTLPITHVLTSGEIGSAGQTSGTVTSNTVELEWSPVYHVEFCQEVLKKCGINLKEAEILQYIKQVEGQA